MIPSAWKGIVMYRTRRQREHQALSPEWGDPRCQSPRACVWAGLGSLRIFFFHPLHRQPRSLQWTHSGLQGPVFAHLHGNRPAAFQRRVTKALSGLCVRAPAVSGLCGSHKTLVLMIKCCRRRKESKQAFVSAASHRQPRENSSLLWNSLLFSGWVQFPSQRVTWTPKYIYMFTYIYIYT